MQWLRYLVASALVGTLVAGCLGPSDRSPADVFADAVNSVVYVQHDVSSGSGVVYDASHIVTNYHVIEDAEEIRVLSEELDSGVQAEVVGFDRQADLAVLRIPDGHAAALTAIQPADPEAVTIGDPVYAIGYPFGGGSTLPAVQLTAGVISARRQSVLGDLPYIQTDASLNAGNSGGALVNPNGELVGMPTWILNEGAAVGLAIEADAIFRVAKEIISSPTGHEPLGPSEGRRLSGTISDLYDAAGYRVWLEADDHFEASLRSESDVALSLADPFGYQVALADEIDTGGTEDIACDVLFPGPHTLSVVPYDYDISFRITASHELRPFVDGEDGESLAPGDSFIGELQFAGDEDTLLLDLKKGKTIRVTLRSWDFDAYLIILAPTDPTLDREDDDSGWGLLGTDAEIEYTAREQGTYEIVISYTPLEYGGEYLLGSGFYRLDVGEP